MSKKYPGGIIRGTPVVPTTSSAPGIWTVCQAQNYTRQGLWPRSPGAPTIGTATAGSNSATVAFTAPSCTGSNAITSYTAISTPGCVTGTGASSPVTVSGLTNGTAYTFRVRATNGAGTGPTSGASNSVTPTAPVTGQQEFITPGTYSWVAPTGVTSVSVVAVGGGTGSGGGLGYKNNITVIPGNSYAVKVAAYGGSPPSTDSYFISSATVQGGGGGAAGGGGGTFVGDGGGNGGAMGSAGGCEFRGGGGAGGYAGAGGAGASSLSPPGFGGSDGSGGGGGGGSNTFNGRGGGVGLLGQGASGVGVNNNNGTAGSGGSGVTYGGGGGNTGNTPYGNGAVRIIWPGTTRSFPSTNTGNL